jgi:hypothetical protein
MHKQLDWLDQLETNRRPYIEEARQTARKLLSTRPYITIDDVRAVLPPPEGVDPRVMGAVFKQDEFVSVGWTTSKRKVNHRRPIQRFKLKYDPPEDDPDETPEREYPDVA